MFTGQYKILTMIFKKFLIPALGFFLMGCSGQITKEKLKTGDLLFCSYQEGELSDAISTVTKTVDEKNYSHMGLIEFADDEIFVIHASIKRGVVKESIEDFLQKNKPSSIDVYRLKKGLKKSIPSAIKKANTIIGLPYNFEYLMNDSCYYCSQLIYEAFKQDNIFELEPMTFKNPGTNEYNKGWINYYRELNAEIPEGKPGCNPNGMASSNKLKLIGTLK